ncbi:MAG TPA: hypothetical protein VN980_17775 [Alphaproteobacteria bacterium]|nr:hypothetical protein [Alphaproteobacteria bacterium]
MTLNRFCLLVAIAAGVAALQGAPLHAQTCAKATGSNTCVYAVKYICGYQAPSDIEAPREPPVKPGNYATAVNIQNFHDRPVPIEVRAVIANLGGTGKIGPLVKFTLKPLEALEFDCTEIAKNLEQTAPFIKGFVDIISPAILSVVAVYTAEQRGGPAPVSIDVVPQQPFAP